jgi:hypothetical protein
MNPLEETGVYKFECEFCDEVYIGQKGRSFVTRIKEHMAHIKKWSSQKIEHSSPWPRIQT